MTRSLNRAFWDQIEDTFDPEQPAEAELFAEREPSYNPLAELVELLEEETRTLRSYLVVGSVGNGKTSELYHFGAQLAPRRMIVLVDLWRHFASTIGDSKALERLQTWELLGLVGVAIHRAGVDCFKHKWKHEPKQLQKALEQLREAEGGEGPAIDVAKLSSAMVVIASSVVAGPVGALVGSAAYDTGLKVLEAAGEGVNWSWYPGKATRDAQDDHQVRPVLDAVNAMIMTLQQEYGRRLLLLVDGLDRAGDERVRGLFAESALLGQLTCDAVWIAPDGVRRLDAAIRGLTIQELCNVPVLARERPSEPREAGLKFYRSLVDKRLARARRKLLQADGPPDPLPVALVDRLAYYSGGVTRDFIKMIRLAASKALRADAPAIDAAMVDYALRESRRIKERAMNAGEIELLERLMLDPDRKLPEGELAARLVAEQRLLAYPNETTWYYPHPLLTLALLKPKPGSPS
ncbi:hypothetical protein ACNOYE_31255 [Nannocystaceae bacterium ST9]